MLADKAILDNLLKDYIGTHYEYDARGNMVKRIHNGQTTTFVWDNFNRMVQSNSQDVRTTYVYDALGRRIMKHSEPMFSATGDAGSGYEAIQKSKIRRDKNLGLIVYGWDGDVLAWESNFGSHTDINHQTGQIEAAFDNSRTTHYIYEPNSFVPMIQASRPGRIQLLPTPDYGRFRRGEAQYDIDQDPVWQYQAKAQAFDAVAFYQCDHLGTPQELTNMNGEIAWAAEYKAWGYAYDALSKAGRAAGLKQPLRFQGQYYDHETGLHYNRHRYYDPHSGRFVSKDPIGLEGGLTPHTYAKNPNMYIDPMGLKVYACQRHINIDWIPSTIASAVVPNHYWLKTDTYEAGMGGDCPVPGQGCADVPYKTSVKTLDHTGQSQQPGAKCAELPDYVDEGCINNKIKPGRSLGTWTGWNQCQTFVRETVFDCIKSKKDKAKWFLIDEPKKMFFF